MSDDLPIYACPGCKSWDTWWEETRENGKRIPEIRLSHKKCAKCGHRFLACWWCGGSLSGKDKVKSAEGAYFCAPPCWQHRLKEDR